MTRDSLVPGTTFGAYVVVRILGEGGMGAVYEARHERLAKRVALKVLHRTVATSSEAVARFMREGEAASRLRHPNVVDVTDVGVEDGVPYMVMEYLEGQNLGAVLAERGALPVSDVVDLALPIASALATAHEEGIVHRDLKPDNIMLASTRLGEVVPKLVDFGISKLSGGVDVRLTATNTMMGTPHYMSPEQARGSRDVDGRTDQYAFGLILYEAVSGQRAVRGESLLEIIHEISNGDLVPLDTLKVNLPPTLTAAIGRMLSRDADARFPDMLATGAALLPFASPRVRAVWEATFGAATTNHQVLAGSTSIDAFRGRAEAETPFATPTDGSPTPLRASKTRVVAIGAVLALAIVAVGTWFALGASSEVNTSVVSAAHPVEVGSPPSAYFVVQVTARPADATLSIDDGPLEGGSLAARLPIDGRPHRLVVRAEGYVEQTLTFRDVSPPSLISLEPAIPRGVAVESAESDIAARPRGRAGSGASRPRPEVPAAAPATPIIAAPSADSRTQNAAAAAANPAPRAVIEDEPVRRGANRSVIIH